MTIMSENIQLESEEESIGDSSEAPESKDSPDEQSDNELANSGWADAVSKILKQKPKKKSVVLAKAKKLNDVKKPKSQSLDFEIEETDGRIKDKEEVSSEDEESLSEEPAKKKKRELPNLRVKPNILEKDRERLLQKIATKGVVQLFNAVKAQQKDMSKKLEEAGPLEVRREKVLKNIDKKTFLNVLMGEKSQQIESDVVESNRNPENSTWSVLKEDFMMGAKMKDWDKELEVESENETQIE
ncbi:unnamed protein product [Phyllotreta striolata]|uniref:RRP15-like protein n=1 Tax=Phyllotreta striolata TaxID=444603 RepID=A0A9N9TIB4_PHYSR|nr:unnamed protein product [Phyllotreta striolata]